jgi:plasmid maintenance system antidote protein VapI
MHQDPRYTTVKVLIEAGGIKTFKEIFHLIPKTNIAGELRTNNSRMTNLIKAPLGLTLKEIDKLAAVFGCTPDKLIELIRAQK